MSAIIPCKYLFGYIYALAEIKPLIEVQTEMSFLFVFLLKKLRYVIHGSTVWEF